MWRLAVPILTEVFTCERAAYASTIGKMLGYGTDVVCTAVLFRQKSSRYRKFRLSPKWAGKLGFSPKLRPLWRAATSQHACGFSRILRFFDVWCLISQLPANCWGFFRIEIVQHELTVFRSLLYEISYNSANMLFGLHHTVGGLMHTTRSQSVLRCSDSCSI